MNASSKSAAWDMVQRLTEAGLVVPPLGATDPSEIQKFGKWHWGTRELDFQRDLYLFDFESVAQNIAERGPLFAVSHGGHGINSYALSLVTTAPSGDVAYFTQGGIFGGYSDLDQDRASINDAYLEVAQEWAELEEPTNTGPVRWLAYRSHLRGFSGVVDLDALRSGADVDAADEEVADGKVFAAVRDRRVGKTEPGPVTSPIQGIVPHLAEALRRLEDNAHLVISVHDSIRYVQFATFRPNLRLETIGTRYLEDAKEEWSVDEVVWLADHGWHDADDDGNLWRHWIPADEDEAAAAAVDALVNVHGVTSLEQVWFQSGDDDALAALEGFSPPAPPGGLQPTSPARAAAINAVLGKGVPRLPAGGKYVALVDYVDQDAVLELLGIVDDEVFRRHDGRWHVDAEWQAALPKAPARSIVPLTQKRLERVLPKVDVSTAGQSWRPFRASTLEMYWPSHRPNDPELFDWSRLDSLDQLREP